MHISKLLSAYFVHELTNTGRDQTIIQIFLIISMVIIFMCDYSILFFFQCYTENQRGNRFRITSPQRVRLTLPNLNVMFTRYLLRNLTYSAQIFKIKIHDKFLYRRSHIKMLGSPL